MLWIPSCCWFRRFDIFFYRKMFIQIYLFIYLVSTFRSMHIVSLSSSAFRLRETISGIAPRDTTSSERIMVLHQILSRTKFSDLKGAYGIERLMKEKVIWDAFPLHEGPHEWPESGPLTDRQVGITKSFMSDEDPIWNLGFVLCIKKIEFYCYRC